MVNRAKDSRYCYKLDTATPGSITTFRAAQKQMSPYPAALESEISQFITEELSRPERGHCEF